MIQVTKMKKCLSRCTLYLNEKEIVCDEIMQAYLNYLLDKKHKKEKLRYVSLMSSPEFIAYSLLFSVIMTYIENTMSVKEFVDEMIENAKSEDIRVIYKNKIWKVLSGDDTVIKLRYEKEKMDYTIRREHGNQLIPYWGKATTYKRNNNLVETRIDYLSEIFNCPKEEVPTVIDKTSLFVLEKSVADRLINNLSISVKRKSPVSFAHLFHVNYLKKNLEPRYIYEGNLGEGIGNINICSTLGGASEWIASAEQGETLAVSSLFCFNTKTMKKEIGGISRLLSNSTVGMQLYDFAFHRDLYHMFTKNQKAETIFMLTPDFLKTILPNGKYNNGNSYVRTVWNCLNGNIQEKVFHINSVTDEEYREVIKLLKKYIRYKDNSFVFEFACRAFGLLRKLRNEVLKINIVEHQGIKLNGYIAAQERLYELKQKIAELEYVDDCNRVEALIHSFYDEIVRGNKKEAELTSFLRNPNHRWERILIVVPYVKQCEEVKKAFADFPLLKVTTPHNYNESEQYDYIIVSGIITFDDKPIMLHMNSPHVVFLLYEFELQDYVVMKDRFIKEYSGDEQEDVVIEKSDELIETLDNEDFGVNAWDDIENILRWSTTSGKYDNGNLGLDRQLSVIAVGLLSDGREFLFSKKNVTRYIPEEKKTISCSPNVLSPGMSFLCYRDFGNRQDVLDVLMEQGVDNYRELQTAMMLVKEWKGLLIRYMEKEHLNWSGIRKALKKAGLELSSGATVQAWLDEDSRIIGPRNKAAYQAIGRLISIFPEAKNFEEYIQATSFVREVHQRATNSITGRLPEIFKRKQKNEIPPSGKLDSMLWEQIDDFVEVLTLDEIKMLNPHKSVPGNYVNVPLEREG